MILMDAAQHAAFDYAGEWGAMAQNFPICIEVPDPGTNLQASVGGDPSAPVKLPPNAAPTLSQAEAVRCSNRGRSS